jgi:hypothetical protein
MKFAALGLALAVLGGCATPAVTVQGDSLCRIVRKDDLTWSVGDTKKTIHNLRRLGAKRDRICG